VRQPEHQTRKAANYTVAGPKEGGVPRCVFITVLRRKERIRQPSIFEERRTSRGVGGSVETGVPFEAVS
jgi:hypothetical protein